MKKNYELTGMSCGGCVNSVKRMLLDIPGVEDAEVQLNPQKATITMSKSINVDELQDHLNTAGYYTIKEV